MGVFALVLVCTEEKRAVCKESGSVPLIDFGGCGHLRASVFGIALQGNQEEAPHFVSGDPLI